MSNGNAGHTSAAMHRSDNRTMDEYDALPAEFRLALQNCRLNWSAHNVWQAVCKHGRVEVLRMIEEMDRKTVREDWRRSFGCNYPA